MIDFTQWIPLPVATYFNEMHGSLFPIFPWHGFIFLGASYGVFQLNKFNNKQNDQESYNLMLIAAIVSIVGIIVMQYFSQNTEYSLKPSPIFFITRYSLVVVLLISSRWYLDWKHKTESFLLYIGRESLLVYWLHLQILYRHIFNGKSLEKIVSLKFDTAECVVVFLVLTALMFLAAIFWNKLKQNHQELSKKIFAGILIIGSIKFLFF